MNQSELIRLESELRTTLSGTELDWLLREVDLAIAVGVPEEKVLRRRSLRRGIGQPSDPMAIAAVQYENPERAIRL